MESRKNQFSEEKVWKVYVKMGDKIRNDIKNRIFAYCAMFILGILGDASGYQLDIGREVQYF